MLILILLFLLVVIIFLLKDILPKDTITIIFSISALIISIYAAFKNEISGFKLKIIAREIVIPAVTAPSNDKSFPIILPIQFINSGYGEGVIDDIVLLITGNKDKSVKYYTPLLEIDLKEFIRGKKALYADNINNVFGAFFINGKISTLRSILFSQEENNKDFPFSEWQIDEYKIDIYIKEAGRKKYKFYYSLPFNVTDAVLNDWKGNRSTYLIVDRKFLK